MTGADPQLCGVCGDPLVNEACLACARDSGVLIFPDGAAVPVAVAEEVNRVCSDDAVNKGPEHFTSRRKLFAEVDRQIRGRVNEVLGDVVMEHKQALDQALGLDALRTRVERVADGVAKDLDSVSRQWEITLKLRAQDLLVKMQEDAADRVAQAFEKKVGAIVAKEVGFQLSVLLLARSAREKTERAMKPAKKKRKAR